MFTRIEGKETDTEGKKIGNGEGHLREQAGIEESLMGVRVEDHHLPLRRILGAGRRSR